MTHPHQYRIQEHSANIMSTVVATMKYLHIPCLVLLNLFAFNLNLTPSNLTFEFFIALFWSPEVRGIAVKDLTASLCMNTGCSIGALAHHRCSELRPGH